MIRWRLQELAAERGWGREETVRALAAQGIYDRTAHDMWDNTSGGVQFATLERALRALGLAVTDLPRLLVDDGRERPVRVRQPRARRKVSKRRGAT